VKLALVNNNKIVNFSSLRNYQWPENISRVITPYITRLCIIEDFPKKLFHSITRERRVQLSVALFPFEEKQPHPRKPRVM